MLQTLQWEPSVKPVFVHVASIALSITSLCPLALIVSTLTSSQPLQLKVICPFSVQVASTLLTSIHEWTWLQETKVKIEKAKEKIDMIENIILLIFIKSSP